MPPDFKARLLANDGDWDLLRDDWERLSRSTPDFTPWQSWDLLSRWWRSQHGSRQLRIVAVELNGVIQMLLPLQLSVLPPAQLRILEPIGMPDDINRPRLSLGVPDAPAFHCAMQLLWQRRREWDAIRIDEKQQDDLETGWLQEFAGSHGPWLRQVAFHPCPYLDLAGSWTSYLAARGARLAKNLRASKRCLEAQGPVIAQRSDTTRDVLNAFDVLVSLHERSWKHEARVGLSQSDSYCAFYRDFVRAQADLGCARAWTLSCNSQPVAATVAFHDGSTYFSAQIAHDAAFSKCSPGTLLEAAELEDLFVEGKFRTYDFLGGALNNKLRWTSQARATQRVWLIRKSLKGMLFYLYYFAIKPRLKRVRSARQPPPA
jgi:Protein involved in cellulose biosynthesis (CelD)